MPSPSPKMPWRVKTAEPLDGMRLRVQFIDGTVGEVHMADFLESPEVSESLFGPLRDPEVFRQVRVEMGAVMWPNGADLAPDTMYDAIRSVGRWTVGE